ncbi:hypothetical protein H2248_003027 [Termitomyces sp. 'cryptogamus']|nr:hypothetical protein H2248_003027 [Termitomyces sp. 'cryptogamus']
MSSTFYQRLPTSDESVDPPTREHELEDARPRPPTFPVDPRFERPTPSPWARAALLIFTAFLFWLAFRVGRSHAGWAGIIE